MKNTLKTLEDLLSQETKLYRGALRELGQAERTAWENEMEAIRITLKLVREQAGRGEAIRLIRTD